ncbi:MAG: 50S ribosomal protein L24 [Chitinophagales bacterium]|jgi:large subunit ribosomal protein L24|nr:50S ribosomal protein L24 [Bacteroidota bacterium]MBK7566389.1 50S ribosomal protein L24 [Bacteroidota bacterium]MBP8915723.1 50S ribosomal protein L24 [Chitinophagales bacterium]MBP9220408.1 50S ribosomal protein L24 [Chitinophagales bacterium]
MKKKEEIFTGRFKPKYHVKKNDMVQVITGDDKGKKGRVIEVNYDKGRVMVEGVNIVSKHTRPTQQYPNGGIIKKEAPIHISNVLVVDPKSGKGVRISRKIENGKMVRYSKKSGEIIK